MLDPPFSHTLCTKSSASRKHVEFRGADPLPTGPYAAAATERNVSALGFDTLIGPVTTASTAATERKASETESAGERNKFRQN